MRRMLFGAALEDMKEGGARSVRREYENRKHYEQEATYCD